MMDKMLVVIFDREINAYEGFQVLQDLQIEGSIDVYTKTVIARDASGKVVVKKKDDMDPVGTGVGLLMGSLIGMICAPLGMGMGVGAGVGTAGGLVYDLAHLGVDKNFLTEVEKSLQPGNAALVAEIYEDWTLPVDTQMEALGGIVLRYTQGEVLNGQIERDATALQADLGKLEAEYHQATGEAKVKLQKKVDLARSRLQAAQDDVQSRIEMSQIETEAKIKYLQEQAARESGERKARREARIAELQAEQKRRSDLLKKAWEHAKEAMK
jgi:uncharacterized membrane protein